MAERIVLVSMVECAEAIGDKAFGGRDLVLQMEVVATRVSDSPKKRMCRRPGLKE